MFAERGILDRIRLHTECTVSLRACYGLVGVRTLAVVRVIGGSVLPSISTCNERLSSVTLDGGKLVTSASYSCRRRATTGVSTLAKRLCGKVGTLRSIITGTRSVSSVDGRSFFYGSRMVPTVSAIEEATSRLRAVATSSF